MKTTWQDAIIRLARIVEDSLDPKDHRHREELFLLIGDAEESKKELPRFKPRTRQ